MQKQFSVFRGMEANILNMNKLSYIIGVIILFLIVAISVALLRKDPNSGDGVTNVVYTDLNITFKPENGSDIAASNFLTDQTVKEDTQNPGLYQLGNTFENPINTHSETHYVVIYDKATGVFNITLLEKPFAQSRLEMQTYLKDLLQITEAEMCQLSYTVAVPGYVDQNASGQDYRFSFCSDAVQL
jgi:predicted small secreted protein